MFGKWIKCKVDQDQKTQFSMAQQQWSSLQTVSGFIAQVGGWLNHDTCFILCLWESKNHYQYFMDEVHDQITNASMQGQTYLECHVTLYESQTSFFGESNKLSEALKSATILRFANCQVKGNSIDHFKSVQNSVWIEAMSKTKGMLAGCFTQATNDLNNFLVVSLWDSHDSHLQYSKTEVPKLRALANVDEDLLDFEGGFIPLNQSWSVLANPST